jgi:hypothetical protein
MNSCRSPAWLAAVVLLSFTARAQPAPEAAAVVTPPADAAATGESAEGTSAAQPADPAVTPEPAAATADAKPEKPARVQVSESMLVSYHLDNGSIAPRGSALYDPTGSNYVDMLNKIQLDASWNKLTAQVRVDSALYANAPVAAANDVRLQQLLLHRYANRLDLEKVKLAYTSRQLDVTLGDTYVTYGRGLVLSLRKVDEFGIDTTARGLSVTGRAGGLTVNALGGWSNIVNVDPATGRQAENPNDLILGGRAEYRFGKWVTPGLNFSNVIYAQNAQTAMVQATRDQVMSFSGTLDFPYLGKFGNLYVEYAMQRRLTQGFSQWSRALYASSSLFLGKVTLLLEYKDYSNYSAVPTSLDPTQAPELALSNFYTAAPTLERVQQLILNNTDVAGGHIRASVKVSPEMIPFVSMAVFSDRTYQTYIFDPYAGLETRWNEGLSRASVSGGYRLNQYAAGSVAPGTMFQGAAHFEWDVTQHLGGRYGLGFSGLHVSHSDARDPEYLNWHEGQAYVSLKSALSWSVALGYEYYTEAPLSIRPHYVNVNGSWQIVKNLLVKAFIGGQRAGIKCVNGVCRNYPAFDGARLEVVAKY